MLEKQQRCTLTTLIRLVFQQHLATALCKRKKKNSTHGTLSIQYQMDRILCKLKVNFECLIEDFFSHMWNNFRSLCLMMACRNKWAWLEAWLAWIRRPPWWEKKDWLSYHICPIGLCPNLRFEVNMYNVIIIYMNDGQSYYTNTQVVKENWISL